MPHNALLALMVFAAVAVCDVAWTKYMLHTGKHQAHLAGVWGAAVLGLGALNVVSYTAHRWLIIPALLGSYVGTYLAVRREARVTLPDDDVPDYARRHLSDHTHGGAMPHGDSCTCAPCDDSRDEPPPAPVVPLEDATQYHSPRIAPLMGCGCIVCRIARNMVHL